MASTLVARVTGEHLFGKNTGGRSAPTIEEVARLAYEFYDRRGRADGYAVDDWLAAERQLGHHYATATPPPGRSRPARPPGPSSRSPIGAAQPTKGLRP